LKGLFTNRTIQFSKNSRRFTAKILTASTTITPLNAETKNPIAESYRFTRLISFEFGLLTLSDSQSMSTPFSFPIFASLTPSRRDVNIIRLFPTRNIFLKDFCNAGPKWQKTPVLPRLNTSSIPSLIQPHLGPVTSQTAVIGCGSWLMAFRTLFL
jgi:hypothetical protein